MNNMDAEKASIATAIALGEVMGDSGIVILSHSVTRGSLTNLTGTGPFPITGVGPVDARIYLLALVILTLLNKKLRRMIQKSSMLTRLSCNDTKG